MATTWAGTSSNQLVTFYALKDAADTGALSLKNTITGSNEIVTKADVEYYVQMGTYNATWSGYSSTRCPTKSAILQAALFDFTVWASTGSNTYTLYMEQSRGGTLISSTNTSVSSTTCLEKLGIVGGVRYNDTIYVYGNYGGSLISTYFNNGSNNCQSSGTNSCGLTYTITEGKKVSVKATVFSACGP